MSLLKAVINHKENGEFKNNFVAANKDKIIIDHDYGLINYVDLDFKVVFEYSGPMGTGTLFAVGKGNDPVTSSVLCWFLSNTLRVEIRQNNSVNAIKQIFSTSFIIGSNTLELINLNLYLNNVLVHTFTDHGVLSIDYGGYPLSIGTFSYGNLYYLNGSIYSVRFMNETFSLDEKSGYRVYGDQGSFGTRSTANAGGLTYINSTMIEKI